MDAIIVICTRVGSSRLPGKALMNIEGLTSLDHILLRIKDSGLPIYLAIPQGEAPHFQHFLARYPDIGMYEGNADSPLHRTGQIIEHLNPRPKYVVRITHDDLLIDSRTMLDLLEECEEKDAGYGVTPLICEGAGVEVIRVENILYACKKRKESTEFISYFVRGEGLPFPSIVKMLPRQAIRRPYRLTLDYPEDAVVLKVVLRELGANASLDSICRYLDSRPHILNINRMPDVTFYTCAKDAAPWISDAMLSVLQSNIPNMEYIVVDDGSKDCTLSEASKFANDARVTLIVNDRNIGLADSSNCAVSEAKGKAIVRLDADDMLIAGAFAQEWPKLRQAIQDGAQIIYPGYSEVDEYGSMVKEACDPRTHHHAGGAVMDRAWLNEVRFKGGIRHWDGLELYKRTKDSARIEYVDYPLWQYRVRNGSMSRSGGKERERLKP